MLLRGPGPLSQAGEVVQLAVVLGELLGPERGPQRVDRLVQHGPAPLEVHLEDLELLAYVPRPHAEDQPPCGEVIESGVLLGAEQGVPKAHDGDVAEQPDALGDGGEVGEGGDRVVPDRAHRRGQPARDGHVVADGEVVEPGTVHGPGDPDQVGGPAGGLPVLGVEGALRLDRQLDAVGQAAHRDPCHSPSPVSPSSSIAFPRTIRSTTSAGRCPICASPTSRDLGQVESECG